MNYDLITIIGPTASGKTKLACDLAYQLDGEIISGDSRQVYIGMDIGTGKDLAEYKFPDKNIPYHLIDIHKAGYKYNIYEYQNDFHKAYKNITEHNKQAILCGGSGLYIESVLKSYTLPNVPQNEALRYKYKHKSLEELTKILTTYKPLHNTTDTDTTQRIIRAIEIEEYKKQHPLQNSTYPSIKSLIIAIDIDTQLRRERITHRLKQRLEEGMIQEVQTLLNKGLQPDDLIYYGLEYKYLTLYLTNKINYDQMFNQLEIAIHQFAKRQMTWFRGMEKRGMCLHWLDNNLSKESKIKQINNWIKDI